MRTGVVGQLDRRGLNEGLDGGQGLEQRLRLVRLAQCRRQLPQLQRPLPAVRACNGLLVMRKHADAWCSKVPPVSSIGRCCAQIITASSGTLGCGTLACGTLACSLCRGLSPSSEPSERSYGCRESSLSVSLTGPPSGLQAGHPRSPQVSPVAQALAAGSLGSARRPPACRSLRGTGAAGSHQSSLCGSDS